MDASTDRTQDTDPDLLGMLRARLAHDGLDGFLVPHADAHQSEYLPPSDERLARLTGFTGSAGFAIVLKDTAAVFVDGRYTLQAEQEVDTGRFDIVHLSDQRPVDWLRKRLAAGMRLGFDAWLHTPGGIEPYATACSESDAHLVEVDTNPIDADWPDRPAPSSSPIQALQAEHRPLSVGKKLERIAQTLREKGADATVLCQGDAIAWTFNLRADDVPFTPLVLAFAIVKADGTAQLFVTPERIAEAARAELPDAVHVLEPQRLTEALDALGGAARAVLVDASTTPVRIASRLGGAGARVVNAQDPTMRLKACKTPGEVDGIRNAHVRDGVALVRFLHWLDETAPAGGVTELAAAQRLDALRGEHAMFRGPSFPTISGAGPNGAVVHYRVTPESDRPLKPGELYLVDSGGQYPDGTTDVTRTVAIGKPTAEMRDRFTRVLKGHIAIATQVFPQGTFGEHLDVLARRALWDAGVDYEHGTGHGVGTYLGVHEGPQRIAKRGPGAALEVGMVVSNEPGYYKAGAYGIRIENLVTVVPAPRPKGAERDLLAFETLTLAPIDLNLVDADMLSDAERHWLNAYHGRVRERILANVDGDTRAWLEHATRAL